MIQEMPSIKSPVLAERIATRNLMSNMKRLMDDGGLRPQDVSESTGINLSLIYSLYRGDYESSVNGDAMASIAQTLHTTVTDLTGF